MASELEDGGTALVTCAVEVTCEGGRVESAGPVAGRERSSSARVDGLAVLGIDCGTAASEIDWETKSRGCCSDSTGEMGERTDSQSAESAPAVPVLGLRARPQERNEGEVVSAHEVGSIDAGFVADPSRSATTLAAMPCAVSLVLETVTSATASVERSEGRGSREVIPFEGLKGGCATGCC